MIARSTCLVALASTALFASDGQAPRPPQPFDELSLTFEVNVTDVDGEVILQAETGQPLERMVLFDPHGRAVYGLRGAEGGIGFSEFRLESGEPSIDEVRAEYPEGLYTVRGTTIDGAPVLGQVELSHAIPARCRITAPELHQTVAREAAFIGWHGDPSVESFTVEVEGEDDDAKLSVHLPGDARSFQVPASLLEPSTGYQIVLVCHAESGNRTIQETWFTTAP